MGAKAYLKEENWDPQFLKDREVFSTKNTSGILMTHSFAGVYRTDISIIMIINLSEIVIL